jgi:hypothetical protein
MSSFRTDDVLMPEPLNLSRATNMGFVKHTSRITGDPKSSGYQNKSSVTTVISPRHSQPKSDRQSCSSSDSESETIETDRARYTMVEASSTNKPAQIPSPSAKFLVNQKAARLLGLDSIGYVSLQSRYLGCAKCLYLDHLLHLPRLCSRKC